MRLQSLMVAMNGEEVGTLYRDGDGAMSFQYATSWLKDVDARPISLSLPLRSEPIEAPQYLTSFKIYCRIQMRF
jgi:serine/threonine-protein kinase HipA